MGTQITLLRNSTWTFSNITAGSLQKIEAVIAANLFLPLIQILKKEMYEFCDGDSAITFAMATSYTRTMTSSIATLLDAFQVQVQFVQTVLNHAAFIKCLLESALSHQDTALVT